MESPETAVPADDSCRRVQHAQEVVMIQHQPAFQYCVVSSLVVLPEWRTK
jgi:hypothetical protein